MLLFYANYKASVALHEVGHGLRFKSFGLDYKLMTDMESTSDFKKDENFLRSFFVNYLILIERHVGQAVHNSTIYIIN